jgi:hypothetical protein
MALGSCNYDVNGVFGECNLGVAPHQCYTSQGAACNAADTLVKICPLQYGGTGQGCQPPNLITTLINIALKPGSYFTVLTLYLVLTRVRAYESSLVSPFLLHIYLYGNTYKTLILLLYPNNPCRGG